MMRRTSSANQLSSDAACSASQTAAIPISIAARIQNSDLAASMMVVSHPFAAAETWFSSSVRTCPCCANAGVARIMQAIPPRTKARSRFRFTIAAASPGLLQSGAAPWLCRRISHGRCAALRSSRVPPGVHLDQIESGGGSCCSYYGQHHDDQDRAVHQRGSIFWPLGIVVTSALKNFSRRACARSLSVCSV